MEEASPSQAAPESAAPESARPAPSMFRTEAGLAEPEPKKIAPIRDVPTGRDPATGKFLPKSGDPNAGVIDEIAGQEPPQEEAPESAPEAAPFEFSYTAPNGKVSTFRTSKDLQQHIDRLTAHASAEARRSADLERMKSDLEKKLAPEAPAPEPEKDTSPKNPFETSLIDDESLWNRIHADLADETKGPAVALARMADQFETKIKGLVDYINHLQGQKTAPMESFLSAMSSINQTSEFMKEMATAADESGELRYPGMRSRAAIRDLTQILSRHNLPLTPENFDLAYQVWNGPSRQEGARPRTPDPAANHQAASAAAVASGRSPVPDPRAEPRKLSAVEEINRIESRRGMFRTGL